MLLSPVNLGRFIDVRLESLCCGCGYLVPIGSVGYLCHSRPQHLDSRDPERFCSHVLHVACSCSPACHQGRKRERSLLTLIDLDGGLSTKTLGFLKVFEIMRVRVLCTPFLELLRQYPESHVVFIKGTPFRGLLYWLPSVDSTDDDALLPRDALKTRIAPGGHDREDGHCERLFIRTADQ